MPSPLMLQIVIQRVSQVFSCDSLPFSWTAYINSYGPGRSNLILAWRASSHFCSIVLACLVQTHLWLSPSWTCGRHFGSHRLDRLHILLRLPSPGKSKSRRCTPQSNANKCYWSSLSNLAMAPTPSLKICLLLRRSIQHCLLDSHIPAALQVVGMLWQKTGGNVESYFPSTYILFHPSCLSFASWQL